MYKTAKPLFSKRMMSRANLLFESVDFADTEKAAGNAGGFLYYFDLVAGRIFVPLKFS